MIFRTQHLFVIERNGRFYTGSGWVRGVQNASVYPQRQVDKVVNIDIGMPCNKHEVIPQLINPTYKPKVTP